MSLNETEGCHLEDSIPHYDYVLAGAGTAGVLAATRLAISKPRAKALLIDQNPFLGGRQASTGKEPKHWGSGLNSVGKELKDYISNTVRAFPNELDAEKWVSQERGSFGVLAAKQLQVGSIEDLFGERGVGIIGGAPAVRDWQVIEQLLLNADESNDMPLAKAWKGQKKSPGMIVFDRLAGVLGVSDLFSCSILSLKERILYYQQKSFYGDWSAFFMELLHGVMEQSALEVQTKNTIIESFYQDNRWHIVTEKGNISCDVLLICQPPWNILSWLERGQIPVSILNLGLKSKPVSIVTLSERLLNPCPLPGITLIPAESVQVYHHFGSDLCYQVPIDFEVSLDAESVVKAIKRLKRARKKLHLHLKDQLTEEEHFSLHSIGWSQSPSHWDRKYLKRLGQSSDYQRSHLGFIGDSYGNSADPDANLMYSLHQVSGMHFTQS